MIEVNLVPDVKLELLHARKVRTNVISASIFASGVSVAIVVLLSLFTFGAQGLSLYGADRAIEAKSAQLEKVPDLSKTLTLQNQLTQISDLHDKKLISSRIFSVVSTIVPTNGDNAIKLTKISIERNEDGVGGVIKLDGQADEGFNALDAFKKTISQTKFVYSIDKQKQEPVLLAQNVSDANRNFTRDDGGKAVLRFTVSFEYPEELFSSTIDSQAQIIAPAKQNATDSTEGVPKSLFTNAPVREDER
jgi:hypothetical protein